MNSVLKSNTELPPLLWQDKWERESHVGHKDSMTLEMGNNERELEGLIVFLQKTRDAR